MTRLSNAFKPRQMDVPGPRRFTAGRTYILVAVVLAGLALIGTGLVFPYLSKGEKMRMARDSSSEPRARLEIPPLDAAAPAEVETATFALG
jgi:hypothetical protein